MLVKVPDAPEPGATLPQSDALQDTLHVTPLPESSPVTIAVTGSVAVASTELALADTTTLICGRTIIGEPPPQLSSVSVERTATKANVQRKLRFIAASAHRAESTAKLVLSFVKAKLAVKPAHKRQKNVRPCGTTETTHLLAS
jgi:hypothetical protein